MARGVVRLGDLCSGHNGFPPRGNDQASPDTFCNNIPVHRLGDHWPEHKHKGKGHQGQMAVGSPNVFVNNRPKARIGDAVSCGSFAAQGSTDTFIN
jgi:uncharacterized Zn-binding protein involved in type VI secretion